MSHRRSSFTFVDKNINPDHELKPPIGRSGRPETARQSYSIDAANEFEPFIEDMYDYCDTMALDVDSLIHESGAELEINFLHGDAMALADQVFTFKRMVREVALKHGIYATFMAKPMEREPGSAMHIHQSIIDDQTGTNIFVDNNGEENHLFHSFIAGHQYYIPHLISLFAPNVNSYRRFAPDISAPMNLFWGYDNRTTGLRVPDSGPQAKRLENRFPGVDVNPYLALAASLASGYLGIMKGLKPSKPCETNANEQDLTLPRTLEEGLRSLDDKPEVVDVLGERFVAAYSAVKREEYEGFNRVISSWEREHLLLNV